VKFHAEIRRRIVEGEAHPEDDIPDEEVFASCAPVFAGRTRREGRLETRSPSGASADRLVDPGGNPYAADRFVDQIDTVRSRCGISRFQEESYPSFGIQDLRELLEGSHRIWYRVYSDRVRIVSIWDARRGELPDRVEESAAPYGRIGQASWSGVHARSTQGPPMLSTGPKPVPPSSLAADEGPYSQRVVVVADFCFSGIVPALLSFASIFCNSPSRSCSSAVTPVTSYTRRVRRRACLAPTTGSRAGAMHGRECSRHRREREDRFEHRLAHQGRGVRPTRGRSPASPPPRADRVRRRGSLRRSRPRGRPRPSRRNPSGR